MPDASCHRCDRALASGQPRYIVAIHVTADVDERLPEDEDPALGIPRLLAAIEGRDEEDLEREVHDEIAFTLCARCRGLWIDNPLGITGAPKAQQPYLH